MYLITSTRNWFWSSLWHVKTPCFFIFLQIKNPLNLFWPKEDSGRSWLRRRENILDTGLLTGHKEDRNQFLVLVLPIDCRIGHCLTYSLRKITPFLWLMPPWLLVTLDPSEYCWWTWTKSVKIFDVEFFWHLSRTTSTLNKPIRNNCSKNLVENFHNH